MSKNLIKELKDLKEQTKDLPQNEKVKLLQKELNKIETALSEIVEQKKAQVKDIMPEIFQKT